MTVQYPFTLAQLAQILSALENERRNPNTKRNAIKAIERNAAQIGLTAEDVFDAADGLLSGRLSAAAFRAALRDQPPDLIRVSAPAGVATEAAEPQPDNEAYEPDETYIMPNAGPLAAAESGAGDDSAATVVEATDDPPVAATAAVAANLETTGTRLGAKEQLLSACRAAAHWLQAEFDSPGQTRADEILRVLRAAIARAEGQPRSPRQAHESRRQRPPRENTKEAQVIAMLRRPEGATLAQIGECTGWQTHSIRGFFAAALKKRHGLAVTSEKPQGGERTYRISL
ncbi:MAG: DUF3489 domain-containing protein [Rhodospirillales bacterium]